MQRSISMSCFACWRGQPHRKDTNSNSYAALSLQSSLKSTFWNLCTYCIWCCECRCGSHDPFLQQGVLGQGSSGSGCPAKRPKWASGQVGKAMQCNTRQLWTLHKYSLAAHNGCSRNFWKVSFPPWLESSMGNIWWRQKCCKNDIRDIGSITDFIDWYL